MGIDPVTIGLASLALTAVSTISQMDAQDDARSAQQAANEQQRIAQQEQKAAQSAQAAAERRQQIREERIKRARIMQSSENTGVTASSGAAGAAGSLSTQLASNLGFNIGQRQAGENISTANQNAADFLSSANNSISSSNQWGQVQGLSLNVFDKAGGFKSIFSTTQTPAPVSNATITPVG